MSLLFVLLCCYCVRASLDLESASIQCNELECTLAARFLAEELSDRSQLVYKVSACSPTDVCLRFQVGPTAASGDSFALERRENLVLIRAARPRALLFAAGRLLRMMHIQVIRSNSAPVIRHLTLDTSKFPVISSPRVAIRGHKMSYNLGTNTYDAWLPSTYERYVRDLILWGVNEIAMDVVPSGEDSVNMRTDPAQFITQISEMVHRYDLMFALNISPSLLESGIPNWRDIPFLDRVELPSGDPGNVSPVDMIKSAMHVASKRPGVPIYLSCQEYNSTWQTDFTHLLAKEDFPFIAGVLYGPHTRIDIAEMNATLPAGYSLIAYPDICHGFKSQFPNSQWPYQFAFTEARGIISPRPMAMAAIQAQFIKFASRGFSTYSEGIGDDVNKVIWSALAWDDVSDVAVVLCQYQRMYGVPSSLVLNLERNWRGELNSSQIRATTAIAEQVYLSSTPVRSWRLLSLVFRAFYDQCVLDRTEKQRVLLSDVSSYLASVTISTVREAVFESVRQLGDYQETCNDVLWSVGAQLYQIIGLQLSFQFGARPGRGDALDTIFAPVTNLRYYLYTLGVISQLSDPSAQVEAVRNLLNRKQKSFYRDFGKHPIRGHISDPSYYRNPLIGYTLLGEDQYPLEWSYYIQGIYNYRPSVVLKGVTPGNYTLNVVYVGSAGLIDCRANGQVVHPLIPKVLPPKIMQFPLHVPAEAAELELSWGTVMGIGGNGRAAQIAELWLS